jgi:hypothetical protein
MKLFGITFIIFAVAFLCLSVGAMFGKPRLKGHCGDLDDHCDHQGDERCGNCTCPTPAGADEPHVEPAANDGSSTSG